MALSGSGFGGAIFSPAVSSLIAAVGWRASFMVLAAVCFIIAFPITVAVFYSRPADKGLEPYGAAEAAGAAFEAVRGRIAATRFPIPLLI